MENRYSWSDGIPEEVLENCETYKPGQYIGKPCFPKESEIVWIELGDKKRSITDVIGDKEVEDLSK
ncbi:MAG: hypothetical protein KAT77_02295 [Nanoarchaeota archaeon]|nr:hypothetical protein [Nanoarchaeota archaeon]